MKQTTYDQLLEAAMNVIRREGFDKASVSRFVKEAGVAQGTFYNYFASKNELVPAIAARILDEQLARMKERGDAETLEMLMDTMIDVTFTITEEFRDYISFCYSGISLYYSFERWDEIYRPYYDWLESQFSKLQRAGRITTELELKAAVNNTVGLIEHAAEAHYLSRAVTEDRTTAEAELKRMLVRALTI
ncbi:TetR family transcriptional regulator [Alkalicoccus luteus]|uniref:TetR family transcriptional regulator n=1 Tax=Alkalicoccus luteus TaxID=1237094 RepID=UPI004034AD73